MKDLRIYDLVTVSSHADATLFRVVDADKQFGVAVIDATIEDEQPNQEPQWQDRSIFKRPTKQQLDRFTQKHEKSIKEALSE